MNRKYYVRLGQHRVLVLAANTVAACIAALKQINLDTVEDVVGVPTTFWVSERGFDAHNDDEGYWLSSIIRIMYVANNGEPVPEI